MKLTILTEAEIRSVVTLDAGSLAAVADGFTRLAQGQATLPPILRIDVPDHNGEVDVKTAYLHGLDSFAIKIASGFFDNRLLGLPTGCGMMALISARTGFPQALLLDNGYLTDVRTGLAGALAAQYLAKAQVETVGIVGSGMQARFQARALQLVRPFQRLLVYGIAPEEVAAYAEEMQGVLGVPVEIAPSEEALVCAADVVVSTTPARQPHLRAAWLHPGLHVTAMGADSESKQELEAAIFARADRIACDRKAQCFRLGELHHALEAQAITEATPITELGELTAGQKPGRQSDAEMTVCDLTGVGVQDTAIALYAYRRALAQGLGTTIGEGDLPL